MKPFLLYGTPRSGSTLVASILAEYFNQTRGIEYLHEYFNPLSQSVWESEGRIAFQLYPQYPPGRRLAGEGLGESYDRIARSRLEPLKKHHSRYFFKLLSYHNVIDGLPWLRKAYDWILVERRNLFEQLLSFLVSDLTGVWYLEGGMNVPGRSLSATTESLERFRDLYFSYLFVKKSLRGKYKLAVYEDALGRRPSEVLKGLSFAESFDESRVKLPPIQNAGAKIALFTNPELIRNWYLSSPFEKMSPLGDQ